MRNTIFRGTIEYEPQEPKSKLAGNLLGEALEAASWLYKELEPDAPLPAGFEVKVEIERIGVAVTLRVDDQRELEDNLERLIEAAKLAYRKHHLEDACVGWEELSEKIADALSNAMGAEEFANWQEAQRGNR